jgi:NADH:ubiquinone oxidoreductase subunit 4 (subunit M)
MIFAGGASAEKIPLTTIAIISTVITAGYYLWFIWRVFFGNTPKELENVTEASWLICAPIVVLMFFSILLGIWPDLILRFIVSATENLLTFS